MIADNESQKDQKLQCELKFARIACVNGVRELTAMLSHEISQPLMVISAYVSGCIRRMEEDVYDKAEVIDIMKAVNKKVEYAGALVHRIKDCVDPLELHYEQINIHELIRTSVSLITHEFTDFPFSIQYEFTQDIQLVEIDEAQIKLVLLSLLKNGLEEMVEAKTKRPLLVIETSQLNPHSISVNIKDGGRGISSEIKNKLFNSRCTTKSKNIGMSLATCRSIIEAHKGDISAQSLLAGGASFKFVLPITQVGKNEY